MNDKRDADSVWDLLEELVKENTKANEAIQTGYSDVRKSVIIQYAGISDNVLYQGKFELDMGLLRVLPIQTCRQVLLDVFEMLREEKCR
jgi:hypothetical protein